MKVMSKTIRIEYPSVYLHLLPEPLSEVCDELPYGTCVTISENAERKNEYIRCETEYGYSGYLHEKYIGEDIRSREAEETRYPFVVCAPFCDLHIDSVYKYRPIMTLPRASVVYGARASLGKERFFSVFHKEHRFFVPTFALRPYEKRTKVDKGEIDTLRRRICDDALSYLGTPYRFGGRNVSGIDCSGLCFNTYFLNGLPLWRDSFADRRFVHEIDREDLLPGDLLYFKGHVALYIGDGEYVHASASVGCVTVGSLIPGSVIYRADLGEHLLCAARSNLF